MLLIKKKNLNIIINVKKMFSYIIASVKWSTI